jgi:hypothetical protein
MPRADSSEEGRKGAIAHGVKLGRKRKLSDINALKPSSCLGSGSHRYLS